MSDSYPRKSSGNRRITGVRITIPNYVIGVYVALNPLNDSLRWRTMRREFVWGKGRSKGKSLRFDIFQEKAKSIRTYLCQELEKIESVVKLRDFLLTGLTWQENKFRKSLAGTSTGLRKG